MAGNRTHLHYVDTSSDDWTYYTYNIENQLTIEEKGGTANYYTYNPVGELISKKVGEDEYSYEYTYEGQMNVFSDGATNAYYTYDSDFRRVEKKVDGAKTKFEYSGQDVVAEYDDNDALAATFNTPELDQNLTVKISDAVYHYLHDGLGSVRNLIDSGETIQNTYDYFAFGSVHGTPTENISNPFRFTGRRWDSESSLHFYRARMYNQLVGGFISKDAVFYPNRYIYAQNNPLFFKDPDGMKVLCLSFIAGCSSTGQSKTIFDPSVARQPVIWRSNFGSKCRLRCCENLYSQSFRAVMNNVLQQFLNPNSYVGRTLGNVEGYVRNCMLKQLTLAEEVTIECETLSPSTLGEAPYVEFLGGLFGHHWKPLIKIDCLQIAMAAMWLGISTNQLFCWTIVHELLHRCDVEHGATSYFPTTNNDQIASWVCGVR